MDSILPRSTVKTMPRLVLRLHAAQGHCDMVRPKVSGAIRHAAINRNDGAV